LLHCAKETPWCGWRTHALGILASHGRGVALPSELGASTRGKATAVCKLWGGALSGSYDWLPRARWGPDATPAAGGWRDDGEVLPVWLDEGGAEAVACQSR
jgi:hypothetical protein